MGSKDNFNAAVGIFGQNNFLCTPSSVSEIWFDSSIYIS